MRSSAKLCLADRELAAYNKNPMMCLVVNFPEVFQSQVVLTHPGAFNLQSLRDSSEGPGGDEAPASGILISTPEGQLGGGRRGHSPEDPFRGPLGQRVSFADRQTSPTR